MTRIGTPYYMAPEICMEQPYDTKSDMWAMGICCYEMLCLTGPFDGQDMIELTTSICQVPHPPIPEFYPTELIELVDSLLQKDPAKRPSVTDCLQLDFLQVQINRF